MKKRLIRKLDERFLKSWCSPFTTQQDVSEILELQATKEYVEETLKEIIRSKKDDTKN